MAVARKFNLLVLLVLAVVTPAAALTRTRFDTNWRFILGDQGFQPACDASAFTQNISGIQVS